ncbi:P-type conjugative transfer protein TrbG [Paraburkholderia sp. A3RO-2L]|uniref:P-type conjugative transfer protein TrbG n=1 Tax=Paraburkholderia sp. A3RO-2L TaxID=3028376 RepID=UPI003DA7D4D6
MTHLSRNVELKIRRMVGFVALVVMVSGTAVHAASAKKYEDLDAAIMDSVKAWQKTGNISPIMSDDGTLLYPYGEYQPRLVCGIRRACDVTLEPGERLLHDTRGDTANWTIDKATSGDDGDPTKVVQHIVFKPKLTGIESNAILYTNRRVYDLKLVSSDTESNYMNRIGFFYPNKLVHDWDEASDKAAAVRHADDARTIARLPALDVNKLDFGYTIRGDDSRLRPERVFNDGTQVFIQTPGLMDKTETPTLLVLDDSGTATMVNYRVKENYFIVDKLFSRAVLVLGSGKDVTKVTIVWDKTKHWNW